MESDDIEDLYFLLASLRGKSRRAYPVARLREFHRFAVFAYGCPEIDWSEIASEEATQLCSPGLVDERTFGHLLVELSRSQPLGSASHRLAAQAFVILAFRAGLRSAEALGLSVDDLHMEGDLAWVSVDKNRLRRLKSFSARRTIPMPHLRGYEARVLRRMLRASMDRTRGRKGTAYVFVEAGSGSETLNLEVVKRSVNFAIKVASGQDHLTAHHLRHSFANRLFLETEGAWVADGSWAQADWDARASNVRRIVGQSENATHASRRTPWILARLLGHAHPRTSLLSYVHLLSDAAESLIQPAPSKWRSPPPTRVINLGALPHVARVHRPTRPVPATLQGADVLSIISDLDNGVPFQVLPGRYSIRFGEAERLARILQLVEGRLPVTESTATTSREDSTAAEDPKSSRKAPMARTGIMSHILESRLPQLKKAISPLYSADARRALSELSITVEEFVSVFGSRRNICMFEAAQFQLVAAVVDRLGIARERLRLSAPDKLNTRVANRAIQTGWLRREDSGDLGGGPVGGDLISQDEPDKVIFEAERKPMHVALSIVRDDSSSIGTRWELALMLIVTAPLLRFADGD
jgi:site-specific recombinase XerD